MKPVFEKINNTFGSSFTVRQYPGHDICTMPFWHIHPEFELVYIKNGQGKRHVGNTISTYTDGDLILLGPNVPHASFSNNQRPDNLEVVVQFKAGFAGEDFWHMAEMSQIAKLLKRSNQGISFGKKTKSQLASEIIKLTEQSGFERFVSFLSILQKLAITKDYELLGAKTSTLLVKEVDYDRITKVYDFVETNFKSAFSPEEVASSVNMTLPAFCRFFKRSTEKTFTTFLNEFRISHACQLIMDGSLSLSEISYECGFQSVSYFNRQFKKIVGSTPSRYKGEFEKVLMQ